MGAGRWTPGLRELIVVAGTHVPFGVASTLIAQFLDVRVSAATVRRITEAAGAALVATEAAFVDRIERELPEAPTGPPHQFISVDGAMVPIVGGLWQEVKTAAIGAIRKRADGTIQVVDLSYCSRLSTAQVLSRAMTGACHHRGTEHATIVAAVADGALWCQEVFDEQVPGSVRILDFPHALEHLADAAFAVFGRDTPEAKHWYGMHSRILYDGDPEVVLIALADLPVTTAADPAAATLMRDQVLAYFTKRRAQITYAVFRARGLPIGSGAIESANKYLVEARLKGTGMHWKVENVNPMLALRAAWRSDRWKSSWDDLVRHLSERERQTTSPTQIPVPIIIPEPTLPASLPSTPAKPPRQKTIVNGKPTDQHPYRQASAANFRYRELSGAKK